MCVKWLSAVKKNRNCTTSERVSKVTTPKGPPIPEKIAYLLSIKQNDTVTTLFSLQKGSSVMQPGWFLLHELQKSQTEFVTVKAFILCLSLFVI